MWLIALVGLAVAQEAPLPSLDIVGQGAITSQDLEVFVREDGNYLVRDAVILDTDLDDVFADLVQESPTPRVVINAHAAAPSGRILSAVRDARAAGVDNLAIAVEGGPTLADPLFPGDGRVTELDAGLSDKQLAELKPKRHRFPQNPYAQTDFTAYTLEFGEAKVGLASVTYGLAPRVQVGTSPVLDILGVYNGNIKANLMREGPLDGALFAQLYVVPVNDLIERFDTQNELGMFGETAGGEALFTTTVSYMAFGALGSLQLAKPWSLHLGANYGRIQASGQIDIDNLPQLLIPGLEVEGGDVQLVPKLVGELVQLRAATDLRFNRRDSIIAQFQAPVYARARGAIAADIEGLPPELAGTDLIIAYGAALPIDAAFRASLSYQFSWKNVDLRFGAGYSPIPGTWLLQAFDLSYRFGGRTRGDERGIRKGYRDDKSQLERGADEAI